MWFTLLTVIVFALFYSLFLLADRYRNFREYVRAIRIRLLGYDYFISFSRPHTGCALPEGAAEKYAIELERQLRELGFSCFVDCNEQLLGKVPETILQKVDRSEAMIVLGCRGASLPDGWVRKEVHRFRHPKLPSLLRRFHSRQIIPVRFGEEIEWPLLANQLGLTDSVSCESPIGLNELVENLKEGRPSVVGPMRVFMVYGRTQRMAVLLVLGVAVAVASLVSEISLSSYHFYIGREVAKNVSQIEKAGQEGPLQPSESFWMRVQMIELLKERISLYSKNDTQPEAQSVANCATALLKLGDWESVWPLLRYEADPRLRLLIIRRVSASLHIDTFLESELKRFTKHPNDAGVCQAIILIFGRFDEERYVSKVERYPPHKRSISPLLKPRLIGFLKNRFMKADDPGVHSACEWTLQRWGLSDWIKFTIIHLSKNTRSEILFLKELENGQQNLKWFITAEPDYRTMVVLPKDDRLPFVAIATKEVTFSELARMDELKEKLICWSGSDGSCLSERPARRVGFEMGSAYCEALSRGGLNYRLPQECEWEVVGNNLQFLLTSPTLDSKTPELAWSWFGREAGLAKSLSVQFEDNNALPDTPGRRMPDSFGLYDVFGNVSEFCLAKDGVPILCGGSSQTRPYREEVTRGEKPDYSGIRVVIDFGIYSKSKLNR